MAETVINTKQDHTRTTNSEKRRAIGNGVIVGQADTIYIAKVKCFTEPEVDGDNTLYGTWFAQEEIYR